MKRFLVILLLSSLTISWINAQVILKNEDQIARYNAIPKERILAHVNTSLFLTGEYLYYSLYCVNNNTTHLSNLSKIGYVELISENGEQVFKQKVKLEKGLGSGDFFIPVTAQTGTYKLLAYTNWMMNQGVATFFQANVHIINPYQVAPITNQKSLSNPIDTLINSNNIFKNDRNYNANAGPLDLNLNNRVFNTRSKVSLLFKGKNEALVPSGVYSISVRKKGTLPQPYKLPISMQLQNLKEKKANDFSSKAASIYLPELRGELLSGRVSSSTSNSIADLKIAASIPGENFYIAIAKTDAHGNFYLNIENYYDGDRLFLEILDKPQLDYNISLKQPTPVTLDYSNLLFEELKLDSMMKKEIVERSIHNQIDNAYYKYKPDSIIATVSEQLFDGKKVQSYKLDDFTRFKSVRETLFEIVKDVSISNMNKTTALIHVQGYNYGTNSGILPLVLIDGLLISNHTTLLDRNALTVDEIKVFRDRFVLGTKVYQGALVIKTKNNNIEEFQNGSSLFSFNLLKPQVNKNYFTQRYTEKTISRIPDDRVQLVWIPRLKITEKTHVFDFFTSDVTGEFEISVEGLTSKGEAVSIQSYFSVQN